MEDLTKVVDSETPDGSEMVLVRQRGNTRKSSLSVLATYILSKLNISSIGAFTLKGDITPDTDNSRSIGTSTKHILNGYFRNGYFHEVTCDDNITTNTLNLNIGDNGFVYNVLPGDYANDAAAAVANVVIGGVYRTGNALKVRIV